MNLVLDFLSVAGDRIAEREPRAREPLASVLLTPRFRASRHVVFLMVDPKTAEPVLVAKVARLSGDTDQSEREAENLRAAHAAAPGGFASIPRLLACEPHRGHMVLLETALAGTALDPASMRAGFTRKVAAVCDWLGDFQALHRQLETGTHTLDALIEDTEDTLLRGLGPDLAGLPLDRTRAAVEELRASVGPAFEHGDLSHPNLLELPSGEVGVLDWELADPQGLPASDLFMFLTYAAQARGRARNERSRKRAFLEAFFSPCAWVGDACDRYARALEIPRQLLRPLFVLGWARCLAQLVQRLELDRTGSPTDGTRWVQQHRYFEYWRYGTEHLQELRV